MSQFGGFMSSIGKWKDNEGPVKAACLSCRQKKAKCDGGRPACGQCTRKKLECIYIKSKRGGARKKRNPAAPSALTEFLKRLDGLAAPPPFSLPRGESQEGDDPTNIVRTFQSREEIFRCYYNEVHPYMAVMPPRHYLVDVLPTLLPDSPFLLAAQAIMTLAPYSLDPNPASAHSKRLRSVASQAIARQALDACSRAIGSVEVIQCLTMISVWDWGTTNDAQAAINRAGQAGQLARQMGITGMDAGGNGFALEGIDWRRDMMRRTWWTLYVYQLSMSLVSGIPPPLPADDPTIKVDFPVCSDKDRSWSTWINCLRQCTRIINIINELVYANAGGGVHGGADVSEGEYVDPTNPNFDPVAEENKRRQVVQIDRQIMEMMKETEKTSRVEQVPGGEEDVVKNQQIATRFALAVAHIHLHRSTAAPEVSLFSKRICGFRAEQTNPDGTTTDIFGRSPQALKSAQLGLNGSSPSASDRKTSYSSAPGLTPPYTTDRKTSFTSATTTSTPPRGASLQQNNYTSPNMQQRQQYTSPPLPQQTNTSPTGAPQLPPVDLGAFDISQLFANIQAPLVSNEPYPPLGQDFSRYQQQPQQHHQQQQQQQQQQQYNLSPGQTMSQLGNNQQSHYNSFNNTQNYPQAQSYGQQALQNNNHNNNMTLQQWQGQAFEDATEDLWRPEAYPTYLPQPWFVQPGGAASLYVDPNLPTPDAPPVLLPGEQQYNYQPMFDISGSYQSNLAPIIPPQPQPPQQSPKLPQKKHKAWGVDEKGQPLPDEEPEAFPPGLSLARCATAAHTIVRLEVLHRSAALALDGTPKWIPFCSCGLVSGAYAFLLLLLAVQAENAFGEYSQARIDEEEQLMTNVKIILAGLEAYGTMWEGIDMMAREVRAAIDAAVSLPAEVQSSRSGSGSLSPEGGVARLGSV